MIYTVVAGGGHGTPHPRPRPVFFPGESQDRGAWWAIIHGVAESDRTEAT